jgi:hypothetical protein
MNFKFRKKYVQLINKIGSKVYETDVVSKEITFKESKWAREYCESFIFNLRSERFNKSRNGKN